MSELTTTRFHNIFRLLSEYKFEWKVAIPDNLKCFLCKSILNNACQAPCGCRYCRNCVNELLSKGDRVCPGKTEECKTEYLADVVPDFGRNKRISRLVIKCPKESCVFECELIDLEEHLRLCSKENLKCPFYGLGCDCEKIAVDEMIEHLQTESYCHNNILIEMVNNVKNEVAVVKQFEIGKLEKKLKGKDETIESMQEEIRLVKVKNEKLENEIKVLKENLENRIKEKVLEFDVRLIGMRKDFLENIEKYVTKVDLEKRKLSHSTDTKNRSFDETETRFIWEIDKICAQKGSNNKWICSQIFYPRNDRYKMQLALFNYSDDVPLRIYLRIYRGDDDTSLKWPFRGDVTIKVINKAKLETCNPITKHCSIDRPLDSYRSSDPFHFHLASLSIDGLYQGNCFTIECLVV